MKKPLKKEKEWTKVAETPDAHVRTVLDYVAGKIILAELMQKTKTNTSKCYSLIARGIRVAHERGLIQIKS